MEFNEVSLEKELERLLSKLDGLEPGTDEYKRVFDEVIRLQAATLDERKTALEERKYDDEDVENAKRFEAERKEKRKDFWVKVAGVATSLFGTIGGFIFSVLCLNYEKTGSLTSASARKAFANLGNFFRLGK